MLTIKLKDIPFYYLNYEGYTDRKIKIENFFNKLSFNYTRISNNVDLPLRQDRIAVGYIKQLEYALDQNIFPFICTDDDINIITNIPEYISIPKEADFIFLGGSLYECGGIKPNMYIEDYNELYYRSYYMLSLMPTLIPNIKSANILLDFLKVSLQTSQFCDITVTMDSKNLLYLTPKDGPYFYQDNYNESVTKFLWKDNLNKYLYST